MRYIKIFESYQSQKDLEKLTHAICYKIGEDTYNNFIDMKFETIDFFVYVHLHEFNPNEFGILNDFIIKSGNMIIGMVDKEDTYNREGIYCSNDGIYLLEKKHILDMFNIILKFDNSIENIKNRFGELIYTNYKNILIHELQHAYDDFRSNGKYNNTSDDYYKRREKAIELSKKNKLKKEELEFIKNQDIEYLNLRYEVDARFTDAITNIDFYKINKSNNMLELYPFSKILKDFKSEWFMTFHHIDDKKKSVEKTWTVL